MLTDPRNISDMYLRCFFTAIVFVFLFFGSGLCFGNGVSVSLKNLKAESLNQKGGVTRFRFHAVIENHNNFLVWLIFPDRIDVGISEGLEFKASEPFDMQNFIFNQMDCSRSKSGSGKYIEMRFLGTTHSESFRAIAMPPKSKLTHEFFELDSLGFPKTVTIGLAPEIELPDGNRLKSWLPFEMAISNRTKVCKSVALDPHKYRLPITWNSEEERNKFYQRKVKAVSIPDMSFIEITVHP